MATEKSATTAQFVRELRRRMGWTQDKFAAAIGCAEATVSRWENGHHPPTGAALRALQNLDRSTAFSHPPANAD